MLVTLAITMLVSAPQPSPSFDWLDRLAPKSALLLQVGDLGGALESEDPGAWLGLLGSPDTRDTLVRLLATLVTDEGAAAAKPTAEELLGLFGLFHGAVMGVPDLERSEALIVVDAEADFFHRVERLLKSNGVEISDARILERRARVMAIDGTPFMMTLSDPNGMLVAWGSPAGCERVLEHFSSSLAPGGDSGDAWWKRCDRRVVDPMMQVFVDFTTLDNAGGGDEIVSQYLDVGYGGISFGRPGVPAVALGLQVGPNPGLFDFLQSFHQVDRDFLRLVPKGVYGANFFNVDLAGCASSSIEILRDIDPSSADIFQGALGAGAATLGADLVEVILPALTGDLAFVAWERSETLPNGKTKFDAGKTSLIVGIRDFEVVLDTVEAIEAITGWASSEEGEATVWQIPDAPGGPAILRLGEETLILGSKSRVAAIVAQLGDTKGACLMDSSAIDALGEWESVLAQNEAALLDALASGYRGMAMADGGSSGDEAFTQLREVFLSAMQRMSSGEGHVPLSRMTMSPDGFFADFLPR